MNNSRQRVPQVFEPDSRPGADAFVYCKGCGQPLQGQSRHPQARKAVTVMMCESCVEEHGHALMPKSGSQSYCYRCGGPDELFIEQGISPVTYHVCPRCVPDRAARYRAGNFNAVDPAEAAPAAPPAPPAS